MNYLHFSIGTTLATCAGIIIGAIWYSPYTLGRFVIDRTIPSRRVPLRTQLLGIATMSIIALTLAYLIVNLHLTTACQGASIEAVIFFGLVSMAQFLGYVYANKTMLVWLVDTGGQILMCMTMGTIIALFNT